MNKDELQATLQEHLKWLADRGGQRANLGYADLRSANLRYANLGYADLGSANLRYANLRSANLRSANLGYADLRYANLGYANLRYANLRYANLGYADLGSANLRYANLGYANLRYANLRSANLGYADLSDTILANINWLAYIGVVPDRHGYGYAYKLTNATGEGIFKGGINYEKGTRFSVSAVDADVNTDCSYGINLAVFSWCLSTRSDSSQRLFLFRFKATPDNVVVPVGSDGKFRVRSCVKVGECNWDGKLKEA